MLVCCQITFLILLCLIFGFLLGVYLCQVYDINGLEDLWNKIVTLFHKKTQDGQGRSLFGNK